MNDISPKTNVPKQNPQHRRPVASDVLAADSRRLASMKRDLRHLYGKKQEALQAEHDKLLEKSRAIVAARRENLPKPKFHHPSIRTNAIGLTHRDYEGSISTLCAGCGHDSISSAIMRFW